MDGQDIQDDRVVFIGNCPQLRKSYSDSDNCGVGKIEKALSATRGNRLRCYNRSHPPLSF